MDKLLIRGGQALVGEVNIAGAKNSVLPIMMASLMCSEPIVLKNVPHLRDVTIALRLLSTLGVKCSFHYLRELCVEIDSSNTILTDPPASLVQSMRASVMLLGPLLARYGEVKLYHPGGCVIGSRPINLHIESIRKMGAEIVQKDDYIIAQTTRLKGAEITFPIVSVTGTENVMSAAVLAEGETIINNAALEPEVSDLAICLTRMGAKISGIGTNRLVIQGVKKLHSVEYRVMPDRIEAATYLIAGVMTKGKVRVKGTNSKYFESLIDVLQRAGAKIITDNDSVEVDMLGRTPRAVDVTTGTFPGFPTDMQAQIVALNSIATGEACVKETVFESRFHHVSELKKMGANLTLQGNQVFSKGTTLRGAKTTASDLRASASLVLASLVTEEECIVRKIQHIDRGYELIEEKFSRLGANIHRLHDNKSVSVL